MGTAVLAARFALAGIFVTAGIGKLLDLPGSRRALVDFGVEERVASVAGTLLPLVELSVAVALVLRPSAQAGAIGAVVLLVAFVAGIANALRHGEAPDCHCFGTIHSAPAGRAQIVRNTGLIALAGLVLAGGPGPAVDTWVAARSAAELVAIGTGILALGSTAIALWTSLDNRRLRDQLGAAQSVASAIPPGLRIGSPAPEFAVPGADAEGLTLAALRSRGLPVVVVFVAAGCGPCESLLPELERWQTMIADRLTLGFVGTGSIARYAEAVAAHGGTLRLTDARAEDEILQRELDDLVKIFEAYRLRGTPSAVIVTPQGTIASATVDGRPAIEALIRVTLAKSQAASADALLVDSSPA